MDMSKFIIAKSDQLNSDDLIGGPITITITSVRGTDASDQPVAVHFDGDDGKPYKPCKSMRRVMVGAWGADASKYVGKSMTLYREAEVQFGGMKVGGIRISHMSGLTEKKTMALTATRGKKGLFTVLPLQDAPAATSASPTDPAAKWAGGFIAKLATLGTVEAVDELAIDKVKKLAELQVARPELHAQVMDAVAKRKAELAPAASGFDDDLTGAAPAQPAEHEDPLRSTLRKLEDAKTIEEVDAIDKETENGRAFLSDAQGDRLDAALAERRSELRATVEA
jgi:hypothetical protein